MNERPSVYLMEKARALDNAISFFSSHIKDEERMLVFMSQLSFWEWEIDNLIESFDTFDDRSKCWESIKEIESSLNKMGISIRPKKLQNVKVERRWKRWYLNKQRDVVAPVDILTGIIQRWNKILEVCEEKYLSKFSQDAVDMGANLLANLSKFKKKWVPDSE